MPLSPEELRSLASFAAERTADGLLCLDTDGKILYANESAARTLGQPASTLAGRDIYAIASEMNPALWKELWKEIRTNSSFSFEFQLSAAGGRPVHVELIAHHLEPAQRELACVFFRDIEERKRLQSLQQEFVSTVSHELRTPMTVIREGVAQVVEGLRGDINNAQERALTLALNGIERMGRIIDELLDISKIESGKILLKRERIDVAALAREVGGTFQSLASDRGLDLRVTTPAGPVMLYADRDRVIQVLTNLVGNSFKFTEKGHVQITVSSREGEVECAVSDTGIGLAAGDLEKIFNKFEQLGQVSFTGEKGTGLGLSISRGIIEHHKGRLWAESAGAGKGSRIAFVIPRLSGRDIFAEQLTGMLKEVARRGGTLSTVIFRIEHLGPAPATDAQLTAALTQLEQLVRRESGRLNDLFVKDVDTLYMALQSTVKREAARIADRVVAAFQESLTSQKLDPHFHLACSIASYPEEAADEETFLGMIFKREAA